MLIAWILALLAGTLVLPGTTGAAERFVADPRLTVDCESAILKGSGTFVQQKLKLLDKCTAGVFKCIQTTPPDDDAEVDPVDVCLEKMAEKCAKTVEAIAAAEQAFTDAITKGCSALDPLEVLRADAVGYELIAQQCSDLGTDLTDLASVAQCIVQEHECAAERLFQAEQPRAGELLGLVDADLGPDSCLEDFGAGGFGVDDVALGKQLDRCDAGVRKVGIGFTGKKLKSLGKCVGDLYACDQLAFGNAECVAKARKTCDKAFGTIAGEALKVEPGVGKSCDAVDFNQALPDEGLGFTELVDECDVLGVSDIVTIDHYKTCLYRQHECIGDELMQFAAPRAAELLMGIDRALPGSFFCPTEDDEGL
jgi:hypothetical protein